MDKILVPHDSQVIEEFIVGSTQVQLGSLKPWAKFYK